MINLIFWKIIVKPNIKQTLKVKINEHIQSLSTPKSQ